MNEKLKDFLDAKKDAEKKRYEEEKQKTLIELGLYEKVYSPDNNYSEEFSSSEWDSANLTNKYYKKVPVEITDEEYQEVKKYSKGDVLVQNNNPIATTLRVIAVLVYIVGFIGGIVIGDAVAEYSWGTAFIYWFVSFFSGTTILGFAEIIQLLHDIKNK